MNVYHCSSEIMYVQAVTISEVYRWANHNFHIFIGSMAPNDFEVTICGMYLLLVNLI